LKERERIFSPDSTTILIRDAVPKHARLACTRQGARLDRDL
jgi:hypothetical protein